MLDLLAEISNIGQYKHDFATWKSVGQKIGKKTGKMDDISMKYQEYVARMRGAGIIAKISPKIGRVI